MLHLGYNCVDKGKRESGEGEGIEEEKRGEGRGLLKEGEFLP